MSPGRRGALIAGAILLCIVEGCPLVPNIRAHHLERPIGQRELARWGERLRGIGFDVSNDGLKAQTLAFSESARERHAALLAPVRPVFEFLQIHQKWALFPIADPSPWWMHVEGRQADGTWRLLYRPLGDEAELSESLVARLEYRRVRAHWNPGTSGPRPDYERFVDWLARRVFDDVSDVNAVRVRYLRFGVRRLDGTRDEATSWHFDSVRER
ncbi:MAG: hypothetical protein AAF938_04135 [Myxococcota bacterium]